MKNFKKLHSYYFLNENTLVCDFSEPLTEDLINFIFILKKSIDTNPPEFFVHSRACYNSLSITVKNEYFRNNELSNRSLKEYFEKLIDENSVLSQQDNFSNIEIPTVYEGEDLEFSVDFLKITKDEIIKLHSEVIYTVAMIGFLPGFPYLFGLNSKISLPRKSTPTQLVKKGSVGIAGLQTGIYPLDSPGGWQIIGKTEFKLFDEKALDHPSVLKVGDKVKFKPI